MSSRNWIESQQMDDMSHQPTASHKQNTIQYNQEKTNNRTKILASLWGWTDDPQLTIKQLWPTLIIIPTDNIYYTIFEL